MKIFTVVGARPQFIKAAPVSRVLRQEHTEILIHTGQHYDDNMSKIFFDELDLPEPDYHLGIGSGLHGAQTGAMLAAIERVMVAEKPDWVLVYGDTNSTLAGALAAAKLGIPIAHVEAGLRSYNRAMPEEINRVLSDHISDYLFCPTETAVRNLDAEGIVKGVYNVGDVMYDALLGNLALANSKSLILQRLGLTKERYILVTVHRAGNTDAPDRLKSILNALSGLDEKVVFPMHPRTRQVITRLNIPFSPNVVTMDPIGYMEMLQLEANANCILTDSGGVQKEAYLLGVRCITLRDETEWTETVEAGWNRLVGTDQEAIVSAVKSWLPTVLRPNYFGDGNAAERICTVLH